MLRKFLLPFMFVSFSSFANTLNLELTVSCKEDQKNTYNVQIVNNDSEDAICQFYEYAFYSYKVNPQFTVGEKIAIFSGETFETSQTFENGFPKEGVLVMTQCKGFGKEFTDSRFKSCPVS